MSPGGLVPIVDLGDLSISHASPQQEEWDRVGREISKAFRDIGFVYLVNHGVPEFLLSSLVASSDAFFNLGIDAKKKYPREFDKQQGYVEVNQEQFDPKHFKHELREAYDVKRVDGMFPDQDVPALRHDVTAFLQSCQALAQRLLKAMALGLGLDENFFLETHREICSDNNASCMRLLNYPAVPGDLPDNTIRCGAHTDYGTITLLFQDNIGGLQVRDRAGQWVDAAPVENAVLVNVGDILQFWTSNKFVATEHRVLIPREEKLLRKARRSIVFFIHPDDPVLITPISADPSFTPITARQHVLKRFSETYAY